jgi:hypothetical protein
MPQVKIYGHEGPLRAVQRELSDVIHSCGVDALGFPKEKRFHRFIALAPADFIHPADRSERYTIVEILLFEGRSVDAKKRFIRLLYERVRDQLQLQPMDLELTLIETPRHDWGIRGLPGDELELSYRVDV